MQERKYVNLSEIDHILLRPDMYIGSIFNEKKHQFLLEEDKIVKKEIDFNYGLFKIYDEIITNSIDEHKRNPKLNSIKISVTSDKISIKDNGGISSKYLDEYKCYAPELIFGKLRSGSNFDDTEKRTVAGNFGIGAKATCIFSKKFIVETSLDKKHYKQTWSNNMKKKTKAILKDLSKENNYTNITFYPDLEKFNLTEIPIDMISVMRKRALDLAALNEGVVVEFNGEIFTFKSFKNYCEYYSLEDELFYCENDNWKIGISSSTNGFNQIAFANNTFNSLGGTHVEYIFNQIVAFIRPYVLKKHKLDVKPSEIRNNLTLFVSANIINNRFSSQTKDRLVTEERLFENYFELPKTLLNKIIKSEIINKIVDSKKLKLELIEKAEIRKLNKKVEKLQIPNLIDCSSKRRENCSISIYEGQSAGLSSIKYRDPKTQAIFLLKGKIMNTRNFSYAKILQNKELAGLISSLGLTLGKNDISNIRYGKIFIVTDKDVDGDNIAALMINFLASNWPLLFEMGFVYRVIPPLMIIKEGKKEINIYSEEEYLKYVESNKGKKYKTSYKKGLGALDDKDYQKLLTDPKLLKFTLDDKYEETLENWFGKDTKKRKDLLLS